MSSALCDWWKGVAGDQGLWGTSFKYEASFNIRKKEKKARGLHVRWYRYLTPALWLWEPGAGTHVGMAVNIPVLVPGLREAEMLQLWLRAWAGLKGGEGSPMCRNSSPGPKACGTCPAGAPLATFLPWSQVLFEISTSDCPLVHQASVTGGLSFVAVRFLPLALFKTWCLFMATYQVMCFVFVTWPSHYSLLLLELCYLQSSVVVTSPLRSLIK